MKSQEIHSSSDHIHPEWIRTILLPKIDKPTFVVNQAAVKQSIKELREGIGLDQDTYKLSCFTKSGSQEVIQALPPEISVVASATDIVETVRRNPDRETALYIGTPNEVDIQRNLITTPSSPYLKSQIEALSPRQRHQIRRITWDGTLPANYPGDVRGYLNEIRSILPQAIFDFRVYPSLFNSKDLSTKQRHGHSRGLDLTTIDSLKNILNPMQQIRGGINLYAGNPLTSELLASIRDFLQLPSVQEEAEPWSFPLISLKDKAGKDLYYPIPDRIVIGGFGGYGDKIPYDELRDFIGRIKNHAPYAEVVLELGTYVVERSSTVIFPRGTAIEEITNAIPDTHGDPKQLFMEQTKRGEPAVLSPVSYAPVMMQGIEIKVV